MLILRHKFVQISVSLLLLPFCLCAQSVSLPESWEDLVQNHNTAGKDTLLFQSFEGTSKDNWEYKVNRATKENAALNEITGQDGDSSLMLTGSAYALFDFSTIVKPQTLMVSASLAGYAEGKAKPLMRVKLISDNNREIIKKWNNPTRAWKILHYGGNVENDANLLNPLTIDASSYKSIHFFFEGNTGDDCAYYIDNIVVYTTKATYTLSNSGGLWNTSSNWTHGTPLGSHIALINSPIQCNTNASCAAVHVSNTQLHVTTGGALSTQNMVIHPEATLSSAGSVTISNKATILKVFPAAGKWYFVSFPFDVYADGIDSDFTLSDSDETRSGNYLYAHTYNAQSRTINGADAQNWDNIKPAEIGANTPVFECGKGYLLALDAAASGTTVRFSSRSAATESTFGKSGSMTVDYHSATTKGNSGWHLCGNPLPGTLALAQIEENSLLDGNIYLYNGTEYVAYSISNSNFSLPPMAAFFVKATADTELRVNALLPTQNAPQLLKVSNALHALTDPNASEEAGQKEEQVNSDLYMQLQGKQLTLTNLPEKGQLVIVDINGRICLQKQVVSGSSTELLSLNEGVYIIQIRAGRLKMAKKVFLSR